MSSNNVNRNRMGKVQNRDTQGPRGSNFGAGKKNKKRPLEEIGEDSFDYDELRGQANQWGGDKQCDSKSKDILSHLQNQPTPNASPILGTNRINLPNGSYFDNDLRNNGNLSKSKNSK